MKIGIVGLGYVGLPLTVAFAEAGCDVVGLDVDQSKIAALREGRSHIEDIALAFSPERVDPGRTDYTLKTTPKVVGGYTPECTERAVAVYEPICDELVRVSTPEVAELSKLLENIFRSVNIALVNEMAMLADRMGIDIWEV